MLWASKWCICVRIWLVLKFDLRVSLFMELPFRETLALLPHHLHRHLLLNFPAVDVCQLENAAVSAGSNMVGTVWKVLAEERIPLMPSQAITLHLMSYICQLIVMALSQWRFIGDFEHLLNGSILRMLKNTPVLCPRLPWRAQLGGYPTFFRTHRERNWSLQVPNSPPVCEILFHGVPASRACCTLIWSLKKDRYR